MLKKAEADEDAAKGLVERKMIQLKTAKDLKDLVHLVLDTIAWGTEDKPQGNDPDDEITRKPVPKLMIGQH
jgi:hypothetical protein